MKLEQEKEMLGFKQYIRTITDDLDCNYNLKEGTELIHDPQYVQIQKINKSQTFVNNCSDLLMPNMFSINIDL